MKILFIYPDICEGSCGLHNGIASISSVLKKNGHQTFLIHVRKQISKDKLIKDIKKINPNLIAFSSTTNQHQFVELYSRWIKEEMDILTVCGGVHTTLSPESVLASKNIDMVCVGEGEYAMLELAGKLEKGESIDRIRNIWVKKGNKIIKNPVRPLIENLDELPFPDRKLFDYQKILKGRGYRAEFWAGRGCPFDCTYCCNHALRKLYKDKGSYVRIRSVDNLLTEIKEVIENYHVRSLFFHDDIFTMFPKWIEDFCKKYPKEFDFSFACNVRVETVNKNILSQLKKAGCNMIQVGIESGDEWLRQNILKRHMTNEQIIKTFKIAHELGLKTYSFNMIGLPFETPQMIENTIALNKKVSPTSGQVSVFYPYPKTELWRVCKENGLLSREEKTNYFTNETTLNLPTLNRVEIEKYYIKFSDFLLDLKIKKHFSAMYPLYKSSKILLGERVNTLIRWLK